MVYPGDLGDRALAYATHLRYTLRERSTMPSRYGFESGSDYRDDGDDRADAGIDFADPGGKSALRATSRKNPRNLPCPTCKVPNRLTPADVTLGYCCDTCADRNEGGF